MKFSVVLAFAAALLPPLLIPPRQATGEDRAISRFCHDHRDLNLSHGACVAFLVNRNVVPHDAEVCRDPLIRRQVGADSHGRCVKALKDLEKAEAGEER